MYTLPAVPPPQSSPAAAVLSLLLRLLPYPTDPTLLEAAVPISLQVIHRGTSFQLILPALLTAIALVLLSPVVSTGRNVISVEVRLLAIFCAEHPGQRINADFVESVGYRVSEFVEWVGYRELVDFVEYRRMIDFVEYRVVELAGRRMIDFVE